MIYVYKVEFKINLGLLIFNKNKMKIKLKKRYRHLKLCVTIFIIIENKILLNKNNFIFNKKKIILISMHMKRRLKEFNGKDK